MIEVHQTDVFRDWLERLRDLRARARIQVRIDRLELGLFGDAKFFDGIGELRIDYGPGYRLYFVRRGTRVVLLLAGGDKSSQKRDVEIAKRLSEE
jgi:putative addiction module killer protein